MFFLSKSKVVCVLNNQIVVKLWTLLLVHKMASISGADGTKSMGLRWWVSTLVLLILTLSRMTLSKVSFSDILRNDYLDHFDTFRENFDFDAFKNDTFENDTLESV